MQQKRILILTGALGDGHNKAAQAILEAAQVYRPEVEVRVVDFLEWTHPRMHTVGAYCFMQWVTKLPSLYGYLYRQTQPDNTFSQLFKRMKSFRTKRMLDLLDEFRPTEVICTLPGAASAMSYMKINGYTSVPIATVMTDYAEHSYWIHAGIDRYLVGAEHVKQAVMRYGVPASRIEVTGIPVRRPFTRTYDKEQLRTKHGLRPDQPVVLVMGGGHGLIGKSLLPVLQSGLLPEGLQVVIVCGRNESLKRTLETELATGESKHTVKVTGFVDYIHELMALADLVITKPGGVTVTEALSMRLPMLLYRPLPGQEQANAQYLTGLGAAVMAEDDAALERLLLQLLTRPHELAQMKWNTNRHQRKDGALRSLNGALATVHHPVNAWEGRSHVYRRTKKTASAGRA